MLRKTIANFNEIEAFINSISSKKANYLDTYKQLNLLFRIEESGLEIINDNDITKNHAKKRSYDLDKSKIDEFSFKCAINESKEVENKQINTKNDINISLNSSQINYEEGGRKTSKFNTQKSQNPLENLSSNKKLHAPNIRKTITPKSFNLLDKSKLLNTSQNNISRDLSNVNDTINESFLENVQNITINDDTFEGDFSKIINHNNKIYEMKMKSKNQKNMNQSKGSKESEESKDNSIFSFDQNEKINSIKAKKGKVSVHKQNLNNSYNSNSNINVNDVNDETLNISTRQNKQNTHLNNESKTKTPIEKEFADVANINLKFNENSLKVKKINIIDENSAKYKAENNPFKKPNINVNKHKITNIELNSIENESTEGKNVQKLSSDKFEVDETLKNQLKYIPVNESEIEDFDDRFKNLVNSVYINSSKKDVKTSKNCLMNLFNIGLRGGGILFSSDFKLSYAYKCLSMKNTKI